MPTAAPCFTPEGLEELQQGLFILRLDAQPERGVPQLRSENVEPPQEILGRRLARDPAAELRYGNPKPGRRDHLPVVAAIRKRRDVRAIAFDLSRIGRVLWLRTRRPIRLV